jgi:hypothetical protein
MRSFRDNNRFMFFYDVLGISFASIYREFCVVLSSFVFDVTLISVSWQDTHSRPNRLRAG